MTSPVSSTGKARTCAVYLRVSKSDGSQTTASQVGEIEKLVAAKGLNVVASYEDLQSAVKHRPGYEKMMSDARGPTRKWTVLAVAALDRCHRSTLGSVQMVLELDRIGAGSGPSRSPIPGQADRPFRTKPITDSGASRSLNA